MTARENLKGHLGTRLRNAGALPPDVPGSRTAQVLEWTAPDGIECARVRSLQISDKGTVRGTD
jgi:hypothetical protein